MKQPSGPYRIPTGGKKPLTLKAIGYYQGEGPGPHVNLPGHGSNDICAFVKTNGSSLQDLLLVGGLRGLQANDVRGLHCTRVVARDNGTPGARNGGNWMFVNLHDAEFHQIAGYGNKGSHGWYLSNYNRGTTENIKVYNSVFQGAPAAALFQINTASGGPTRGILIQDTIIQRTDNNQELLNILGAGTPNDLVQFVRVHFEGGTEMVFSNYDAGRPSFVLLQDCGDIHVPVRIEGGSRLILKGNTRLLGKVTGKVN